MKKYPNGTGVYYVDVEWKDTVRTTGAKCADVIAAVEAGAYVVFREYGQSDVRFYPLHRLEASSVVYKNGDETVYFTTDNVFEVD